MLHGMFTPVCFFRSLVDLSLFDYLNICLSGALQSNQNNSLTVTFFYLNGTDFYKYQKQQKHHEESYDIYRYQVHVPL